MSQLSPDGFTLIDEPLKDYKDGPFKEYFEMLEQGMKEVFVAVKNASESFRDYAITLTVPNRRRKNRANFKPHMRRRLKAVKR